MGYYKCNNYEPYKAGYEDGKKKTIEDIMILAKDEIVFQDAYEENRFIQFLQAMLDGTCTYTER